MNLHVKVKGPFLYEGRELIEPGSVVQLDEVLARDMVKRGMGELHPGPAMRAPSSGHTHGTKSDGTPMQRRPWPVEDPERQTLDSKLAMAERAVAKPQAGAR